MDALLVLEDGTTFPGRSFGMPGEQVGEEVFNTGMTGYQEILTDPSYAGQMVTMTYPHIGNTGVNDADPESGRLHVRALIVREAAKRESNWRARQTLVRYLREHEIMALTDIDTRALTRHIRQFGALRGAISTVDLEPTSLQKKALAAPTTSDVDLVAEVCCRRPYEWSEGVGYNGVVPNAVDGQWHVDQKPGFSAETALYPTPFLPHVVAYDCGIKRNILRQLVSSGCRVTVVPASTSAEEALAFQPDGIFLSNGPGDPAKVDYLISTVRSLVEHAAAGGPPIFGICLGHQILGLAMNGQRFKLKFGHHGSNHPVKDLHSGQIAITAQNHNFAIRADSLPAELEVTHLNLYDHTVEGLRHRHLPVFSVQYHPEAAPGPHDANPLFAQFVELMRKHAKTN